jgi:hypothetical protein
VVLHTCNPRAWEAEAGGLWVPGQCALHSKQDLFPKQRNKQKNPITKCFRHSLIMNIFNFWKILCTNSLLKEHVQEENKKNKQ